MCVLLFSFSIRGGSGSSGVVLNRNGGEIGAVEGFGVLNPYLVGLEAAVEVVLAVVEDLWRNVEEKDALLRVCCVAGSGLDTEEMRTRLRDSVQARLAERFGDVQLLVVEDTMGAIGFLGGKGAVVIAGTGSVARFVPQPTPNVTAVRNHSFNSVFFLLVLSVAVSSTKISTSDAVDGGMLSVTWAVLTTLRPGPYRTWSWRWRAFQESLLTIPGSCGQPVGSTLRYGNGKSCTGLRKLLVPVTTYIITD